MLEFNIPTTTMTAAIIDELQSFSYSDFLNTNANNNDGSLSFNGIYNINSIDGIGSSSGSNSIGGIGSSISSGSSSSGNSGNYTTSLTTDSTVISDAIGILYDWCNQTLLLNEGNGIQNNASNCNSSHNLNNTQTAENEVSYSLPWWRQLLWSILYGGMVIVATGGNLIVIWIVMTTKRMRTVTNYFIVNLSIADAMVSSLNVTFSYIYMLHNDWPFGELYCKISQFVGVLSISASVFTLMAISIDRYVAIMKPLQPRMSKRSNLMIAAIIWIASIVIASPIFLYFTTAPVSSTEGLRTVCYGEWPDGQTNHSQQEYIYNILFMLLTYFLPIISMTVTYSRVGLELWGSKAIGEYTPRQVENVRSKRRVVKMMMVVVLIFAVCWLPFHLYFIVTSCYPTITELPYIQEVYLLIYWLAMSNSMYNPIIYCWMNSRFRYGFKMFFRWCPFVRIGAETLNRRDHMTSRYSCSGSPDHNRIKRNDTQRSFLYTCPGSPKSRRISHCGIVRNSILSQRDAARFSAPIGNTSFNNSVGNISYHQRLNSLNNANSEYTTASMGGKRTSSKDLIKMESRSQMWQTPQRSKRQPSTNTTTTAAPTATITTTSLDGISLSKNSVFNTDNLFEQPTINGSLTTTNAAATVSSDITNAASVAGTAALGTQPNTNKNSTNNQQYILV